MQWKVPPYSTDAERSLLGALLVDKESAVKIADLLVAEDFYDGNHGTIYSHIIGLYQKWKPIDLITVSASLEDQWQLDSIGGNPYLADLTTSVPTSAHIYEYAQIIKTKWVLRKLISSGNEIIWLGYKEDQEINKLLEQAEQSLFGVTQTFIKNKLTHIKDVLDERYEEYASTHADPKALEESRIKTGYGDMDNKLQWMRWGDMVILAARPSMGKTSLALNIAQNIAAKKSVAFFSLEMGKEQLVDRLVCAAMGIDSWKLQKWELTDEEFWKIGQALSELSTSKIYIDDSPGMNMLEIKSKARRLKMESGLDMIMIDYLQLIHGSNPANRVQEIGDISRNIKALARELDVPIIALSQLSRAVESRATKEPILSDLRESGSIEQDADIVMMIYREEYYNQDLPENDMNKWRTTVFIRKNRNGPVGQVDMTFDGKYMKFREVDKHHIGF